MASRTRGPRSDGRGNEATPPQAQQDVPTNQQPRPEEFPEPPDGTHGELM